MKNLYDPISWLVGGEAGYGIATMGAMFARACSRAGLSVFGYSEYPSLIRGGHNTAQVRFGYENVRSHSDKIDIMIALNEETVDLHSGELAENAVVIYDGQSIVIEPDKVPKSVKLISIPLAEITKELGASRVMRNMVAFAASAAIVGLPFEYVQSVTETNFERKGPEVLDMNMNVAKAGYEYAEKLNINFTKKIEPKVDTEKQIVLSGNDAISLGAIKAGVKFMSAYPMTPVTSIMLNLAKNGEKYGIVMKQTEDEIAAINMAIGASHMGVRSMTATSGGGFALMTEALGMSAMTETPLVAVEGTRPGPSTGLPTWTDQGDLRFVLHASQGEFPMALALPGDVEECFEMTLKAFNIADEYQMPFLIITDKYLGESIMSAAPFKADDYVPKRGVISTEDAEKIADGEYLRFKITDSGISPRALPGYPNCIYTAATDEHAEDGDLDETSANRIAMFDKRARKLDTLMKKDLNEEEMITLHGPSESELTLVGWGSTKGPIREAMEIANKNGNSVNFLQIKYASPFPAEAVGRILGSAKKILLIENNGEAQMGGLIREKTGVNIQEKLLRYDGRPINAAEVSNKINQLLG